MKPRKLNTLTEMVAVSQYDPSYPVVVPDGVQDIQIYYNWFLMSGVGWVCLKGPSFKGYLSTFVPDGLDEEGLPQATMTITVAEGEG